MSQASQFHPSEIPVRSFEILATTLTPSHTKLFHACVTFFFLNPVLLDKGEGKVVPVL